MNTKMPPRRLLPRRRPGRPKELTDAHLFTVRFDRADYDRLQRVAGRYRIALAHVLRVLVRRELPDVPEAGPTKAEDTSGEYVVLRVRVSAEEHAHLKRLSREQGVSMAELTRRALSEWRLLPADDGGNRARGAGEE